MFIIERFVRNRITQLRLQKDVSEYQMSYDLGHSRSYINNITSGKSLPSLSEFFAICDYFQITPLEFFNHEQQYRISNQSTFYISRIERIRYVISSIHFKQISQHKVKRFFHK